MGKATTIEERNRMIELSRNGYRDTQIAEQLKISRWTVRKWRRRHLTDPTSLISTMGRPYQGPLSSFPVQLRKTLRSMRCSHPGWGAKTLLAELEKNPNWCREKLPRLASINQFLKAEDLTRPYRHHSHLPQPVDHKVSQAHEQWEMDARGKQYIPEVGVIMLINLNDLHSHARLLSYPCWVGDQRIQRHPDTYDYQVTLRLAFTEWGLPLRLGVDHESVFFDNDSASPFPTRLHLWLIALGISLCFGRKGTPTDQGMTERSHQLWATQVLEGQTFKNWEALYQALQQRRNFLNKHLPCSTINHLPPLVAHPQAEHSGKFYHPQREEKLMDMQRIDVYLAQGKWFRRVSKDGTISLGGKVYYLTSAWKKQELEITFDKILQKMVAKNELDQRRTFTLKECNKKDLIGKAGALANIPCLQLRLPFTWEDIRLLPLNNIT